VRVICCWVDHGNMTLMLHIVVVPIVIHLCIKVCLMC
jgi:hypothetical protein